MTWAKRIVRLFCLVLVGLTILAGPLLLSLEEHQAGVQAAGCWRAAITEQWPDLSLAGSVLRVSVEGKVGLPVTVRSQGGFETVGFTGTKPEYGPYVAEFAPLSKGTYFIEPQGLGIVFEVWLDAKHYTRVDFTPKLCVPTPTSTPRPMTATATRKPTATVTATPTPLLPTATHPSPAVPRWQGRIVEHLIQPAGHNWGTIAVRVIGRPAGQEVEIWSGGWSATGKTGTKPEHGPDACEFGALHTGTYRLTPTGLETHLDVTLEQGDFVLVEFYQTGRAGATIRWVASVVENTSGSQPTEYTNSAIAVIVGGKPWHEVEIRSDGWSATTQTGTKPDYGPDACEFGGLRAATYTITPKDLDTSIQVTMDGWGWAMVRFEPVSAPAPSPSPPPAAVASASSSPTPTPSATPTLSATASTAHWQAWVISNSSGAQEGTGIWSVIVVRVINYGGVPVTVTGGGGWSATCITGSKPEHGPDACDFGGLWPGVYHIRPEGADIEVEVEMDGLGTAFVDFAPP